MASKSYPKTIGGCCDRLLKMRDERIALQRKVDEMKEEESALTGHALKMLAAQKLKSGSGKIATITVNKPKKVGRIEDWPKFFKWIASHDAHDLVQQRVAGNALRDRLEAGESLPPGLRLETVVDVSLTKRRKS